jgi:hypothetical protein
MKLILPPGSTSQTTLIFVQDSSKTTGAGLPGLAWNTAGLTWYYYRETQGTGGTQVTLATMTLGTWATGGFVEIDATNMPGWYSIGIPDAALAVGKKFVGMVLRGATNMAPVPIEIQLGVQAVQTDSYDEGSVYIDTTGGGTAGAVSYVNGTQHNPVDNIADATTLAVALKLKRFHISQGSSLSLGQAYTGYRFWGRSWTCLLNGYTFNNCYFQGGVIGGTGLGTGLQFNTCAFGSVTLPPCFIKDSVITSTFVFGSAGTYHIDGCFSGVADPSSPPIFDFGTTGGQNNTLQLNHYSGSVQLNNVGNSGTDVATISGRGLLVIASNCTSGNIYVRGLFNINDNGTSTVTETGNITSRVAIADLPANFVDMTIEASTGIVDSNVVNWLGEPAQNITTQTELESSIDDRLAAVGLDAVAGDVTTVADRQIVYEEGAVWIDTVDGAAGDVDGVNGRSNNPVSNLADANTIATGRKLHRFNVAPGSTLTFDAPQEKKIFRVTASTVNLGGQSVALTTFMGREGVMIGVCSGFAAFLESSIDVTTFSGGSVFRNCVFYDRVTLETGIYTVDDMIEAGDGNTVFDFSQTNIQLVLRHVSGDFTIENLGVTTGHVVHITGNGHIILDSSCVGGTVTYSGGIKITNNGTGVTLTQHSEFATNSKLLSYTQLLARSDAAIETDNATELAEINADGGSGAGDYSAQSESQEALRDRGDAAWITGGGGSISDILNVYPLIPLSIDLANTASVRIGLMLINTLDDLPTISEITAGTISIHRKAIGGTAWLSTYVDEPCDEAAGIIYFDVVFGGATGYSEGDSIRITLKNQKITVAANDYEITNSTGQMFYTSIRQTVPTVAQIQAELEEDSASLLDTIADSISTAYGDPTGVPPATASRSEKIDWLYEQMKNPAESQDLGGGSGKKVFKDSAGTEQWKKAITVVEGVSYSEDLASSP